ncbi:N-alpha-acetyltransferase 50 [Geosmithia morbida]|uniref:N-alpha-acetyltransferase 50 n=1 Tax=Geosmithia morbida TaxID=1094350 RepID=A0A9P4YYD2_9HYPO|nr:N-alpha-acetyltransferase 50 [Geosmithia morbida]KAF4124767.1 N-alpha-acetyltransferase 50 [Geosmithia morbida]
MSLPTAQTSIKSFFQSKPPKYAPPPGSAKPAQAPAPAPTPAPVPPQSGLTVEDDDDNDKNNIPHEATIRPVTYSDLNALRRINALLLPVPYPEDFYRRAAEQQHTSRVITWSAPDPSGQGEDAKVIGGVVCHVEPSAPGSPSSTLYIRSLCVLAPYRGLGLASAAVDAVVASVRAADRSVNTISAHVWTDNEDALAWYEARGFRRHAARPIAGYYRNLRPDSAWLVQRDIAAASPPSARGNVPVPAPAPAAVRPSPTAAVVNLPPMSAAPAAGGPPMGGPPRRPGPPLPGQSFQNQRPETEWNDLPADMAGLNPKAAASGGGPPSGGSSAASSQPSSRSVSAARKKRDRSYPAAAFGA